MSWIKILTYEDKPNYYKPVTIFANNKIYYERARVCGDDDDEYYTSLDTDIIIPSEEVTHWMESVSNPIPDNITIKVEDLVITPTRDVIIEKEVKYTYTDPKDLRAIPPDRLKLEGKNLGYQTKEWHNLFDIQSAIRVHNSQNDSSNFHGISQMEMWCILSNRFLIIDRLNTIEDVKIFSKYEMLFKIQEGYSEGYNDGKYKEFSKQHEYVSKINESL